MSQWNAFPHSTDDFDFSGEHLEHHWQDLHKGDLVPFPDAAWVEDVLASHPDAAPDSFDGDINKLAGQVQDAWRAFHSGDFGAAVEISQQCGLLAHAAANKAAGIYANYLEDDDERQADVFFAAAERAETAMEVLPDDPNSWYFHAFNLGRYSQSISIVEALRQGIGGKIHNSLTRTLELEPDHAEAHTAFGMYHAEIIDKVGRMIGGMTYGASSDKALEHFERALELTPNSPIARMEYGNGLYLLFGDKRLDEVTDLYVIASEMTPLDAMEMLDIESAKEELE